MSPERGSRVAIYIRVSTGKQADTGHSLDGQRARLLEYAAAQGYVIVETIVDEGRSAGTLNRPGIVRLTELANAKAIDAVLATKGDRIFRSLRDQLNMTADLASRGVSIVLSDEDFDTTTPAGEMVMQVRGAAAQYERTLAGTRTREGMAAARAKGVRLGRPPLGYRADPDRKGALVAVEGADEYDARRAELRDRIAVIRAEGGDRPTSWRRVAERLNADRVPTITGKVGTWDHKRAKAASAEA